MFMARRQSRGLLRSFKSERRYLIGPAVLINTCNASMQPQYILTFFRCLSFSALMETLLSRPQVSWLHPVILSTAC